MADITDIKTIIYTEKTLGLQEQGVVVIQTSPKVTKNGLKEVLREYFGITPLRILEESRALETTLRNFTSSYLRA